MGKVVFLMNLSLDGFVDNPTHGVNWTTGSDELLGFFNDQTRRASALLYGRRLYELMAGTWPDALVNPPPDPTAREYARIWNAQPKLVFSSTLERVIANSRLVRGDIVDELPHIQAEFDGELQVAGPTLASALIKRNLIDEYRLVVHPVLLGGGTHFFPALTSLVRLRPTETRTFASGVRYVAYETVRD